MPPRLTGSSLPPAHEAGEDREAPSCRPPGRTERVSRGRCSAPRPALLSELVRAKGASNARAFTDDARAWPAARSHARPTALRPGEYNGRQPPIDREHE